MIDHSRLCSWWSKILVWWCLVFAGDWQNLFGLEERDIITYSAAITACEKAGRNSMFFDLQKTSA